MDVVEDGGLGLAFGMEKLAAVMQGALLFLTLLLQGFELLGDGRGCIVDRLGKILGLVDLALLYKGSAVGMDHLV